MKWIIYFTIICFFIVVAILMKAIRDAKEFEKHVEAALNNFEDEEVFMENDFVDEYSPESIISDELIKVVSLKQKLKKIEEERIESFDFDNREDGK